MKIKMKETRLGSPDGFSTKSYEKGAELDVSADIPKRLAEDFLKSGSAEAVSENPSKKTKVKTPKKSKKK